MSEPLNSKPAAKPPAPKPKSIMRSLGEFFGHIAHAVKTDPAAPNKPCGSGVRGADDDAHSTRRVVSSSTHEEPATTGADGQSVILRRTTIEEIEVRPAMQSDPPQPGSPKSSPD